MSVRQCIQENKGRPAAILDARAEMATLRSINAHLVRQIEELKQREAHAQRMADRDGLTGLYNRRKMHELLDASLADAARHGQCVGLLFVDLDGFKGVNDRHGHAVGDQLLIAVASRLLARSRSEDRICRYGGDEFVVILSPASDRSAVSEVAKSVARRIALPFCNAGIELNVTASVGFSIYPDDAACASDLMERADQSMYRAKATETPPSGSIGKAPARRRNDSSPQRLLR